MKIEKSTPESTRFHQNHFDALCERYGNCIVSRAKFEEKMFSFEETLEKYCVQKCSDPNYNEEQHKVTEKKVRDYILSVFPEKKSSWKKNSTLITILAATQSNSTSSHGVTSTTDSAEIGATSSFSVNGKTPKKVGLSSILN